MEGYNLPSTWQCNTGIGGTTSTTDEGLRRSLEHVHLVSIFVTFSSLQGSLQEDKGVTHMTVSGIVRSMRYRVALTGVVLVMLLAVTFVAMPQRVVHADSIPGDAVWSYVDDYYQAWARAVETDGSSGEHWNLVIQTSGGGNLLADFHLTYEGLETDASGAQQYVWGVDESVQGFCSQITESVGPDLEQAAMNAVAQLANQVTAISEDVAGAIAVEAYDAGSVLWQLFQELLVDSSTEGCTVA